MITARAGIVSATTLGDFEWLFFFRLVPPLALDLIAGLTNALFQRRLIRPWSGGSILAGKELVYLKEFDCGVRRITSHDDELQPFSIGGKLTIFAIRFAKIFDRKLVEPVSTKMIPGHDLDQSFMALVQINVADLMPQYDRKFVLVLH